MINGASRWNTVVLTFANQAKFIEEKYNNLNTPKRLKTFTVERGNGTASHLLNNTDPM